MDYEKSSRRSSIPWKVTLFFLLTYALFAMVSQARIETEAYELVELREEIDLIDEGLIEAIPLSVSADDELVE